jgi:hypothetical protein
MEADESPMLQRLDVMNDSQREHKSGGGDSGHADQDNVNGPMQVLTAATVRALFEMFFVVATHGRGDTGDVVAPTGQDVANH